MTETGYTALPNHIYERLLKTSFSKIELKIILFVIRYTFGYHRENSPLSLSFISNGIVTDKRRVSESVKKLIEKHILVETKAPTFNAPREIKLSDTFVTVDKSADCGVDKSAYTSSRQNVNQEKKYINKNINKRSYPKKEEKPSCCDSGFDPDEFFRAALEKTKRS